MFECLKMLALASFQFKKMFFNAYEIILTCDFFQFVVIMILEAKYERAIEVLIPHYTSG